MCSRDAQKTKCGILKKKMGIIFFVSLDKEQWMSMPKEMILKLFKKCGNINDMDETEDGFIYESDEQNSSGPDPDFYEVEGTGRDFKQLLVDSDSDSEFEIFD